jgi:arginine/ornithine succinyltransferase subunit-like protein
MTAAHPDTRWALREADSADLATISHWLHREALPPAAPGECVLVAALADDPAAHAQCTLRIVPRIGLVLPHAWFHVGTTVHAAPELALFHRQRTLLLGHDLTGATELADIACAPRLPAAEAAAALQALAQAALDRIAADHGIDAAGPFPGRGALVMAELPGPRDANGHAPFWHGLGRHFYAGEPAAALAQHGPAWRSHVAALLPRQIVNTAFLPEAAQAAIGQVHAESGWQLQAFTAMGFAPSGHVNVEDGGPVVVRATPPLQ